MKSVDQLVFLKNFTLTDILLGKDLRRKGVNIFDQTLSLVVNYPTTNAKRPISSVSLQLLCEIADKTYICIFVLLFALRSLVFMGQFLWTKM